MTVTISAGKIHDAFIGARAAGASFDWSFVLQEYGIEFQVDLLTPAGTSLPVLPRQKFKVEDGHQQGRVVAPAAGTLVFRFDNGHSMFRSKTLSYRVTAAGAAAAATGGAANAQ